MTRMILGAFFLVAYPAFVLMNLRERAEKRQRASMFDAAQKLRRSQERRALDFERARARARRAA